MVSRARVEDTRGHARVPRAAGQPAAGPVHRLPPLHAQRQRRSRRAARRSCARRPAARTAARGRARCTFIYRDGVTPARDGHDALPSRPASPSSAPRTASSARGGRATRPFEEPSEADAPTVRLTRRAARCVRRSVHRPRPRSRRAAGLRHAVVRVDGRRIARAAGDELPRPRPVAPAAAAAGNLLEVSARDRERRPRRRGRCGFRRC